MTDLNKTLSDIDIVMNLLKYGRTRAAMTTLRALRETTLTSMGDECAEEYNTKYENQLNSIRDIKVGAIIVL